jgi:hypothetical protein
VRQRACADIEAMPVPLNNETIQLNMTKKTQFSALLFAVILLTVLPACKKYPEGPGLSMRSKKARVANEWKIANAFEISGGVNTTSDYINETWEFTKKGEFYERDNGVIDKTGTWEFIADKEAIQILIPGKNPKNYTILKLKNKEMWLRDSDEEYHLVPR